MSSVVSLLIIFKKAKSSITLFESQNTKIDEVKDVLINKFENPSSHPKATCKNDNKLTLDSMSRNSLEEHDHDVIASKSVVFYNVVESNDDNEVVSDLITILKTLQSSVKLSTRLGRKSAAISFPVHVQLKVYLVLNMTRDSSWQMHVFEK